MEHIIEGIHISALFCWYDKLPILHKSLALLNFHSLKPKKTHIFKIKIPPKKTALDDSYFGNWFESKRPVKLALL
jgi:hypothetical protein